MSLKNFKEFLHSKNVSITSPRLQVYSILSESDKPLSMNQLIALCAPLDRVTIYRVIELFEKISVVHKIQIGWKYKLELNDPFQHHHHHISCTKCGKVVNIEEPAGLEKSLKKLGQEVGFVIEQHTLELSGVCKDCC